MIIFGASAVRRFFLGGPTSLILEPIAIFLPDCAVGAFFSSLYYNILKLKHNATSEGPWKISFDAEKNIKVSKEYR